MEIKKRIKELVLDAGEDFGLAVVLRAIENSYMARGISKAFLTSEQLWTVYGLWNLEHDNYDQQIEECKQFIGSLLGV